MICNFFFCHEFSDGLTSFFHTSSLLCKTSKHAVVVWPLHLFRKASQRYCVDKNWVKVTFWCAHLGSRVEISNKLLDWLYKAARWMNVEARSCWLKTVLFVSHKNRCYLHGAMTHARRLEFWCFLTRRHCFTDSVTHTLTQSGVWCRLIWSAGSPSVSYVDHMVSVVPFKPCCGAY